MLERLKRLLKLKDEIRDFVIIMLIAVSVVMSFAIPAAVLWMILQPTTFWERLVSVFVCSGVGYIAMSKWIDILIEIVEV